MSRIDAKTSEALAIFFERRQNPLPPDGPLLAIRAEAHPWLQQVGPQRLSCLQTSKPHADALTAMGFRNVLTFEDTGEIAGCILLAGKHRDENLFHLAKAASLLADGGPMVCVAANETGAATLEKKFAELFGGVFSFSKRKCRVFWATKGARQNPDLLRSWLAKGELQPIEDSDGLFGLPGVFSGARVDPGSALLAASLPRRLEGVGADLGAGYGYLSRELLRRFPDIRRLDLFEAEHRALAAARHNLADWIDRANIEFHWRDIAQGLDRRYDWIAMNPPFHLGKAVRVDLGRRFIEVAADALRPGGSLYMVANRRLPYEDYLRARFRRSRLLEENSGYKVYEARKN